MCCQIHAEKATIFKEQFYIKVLKSVDKRGSSITSLTFGYFSRHNDTKFCSRLPPTQCDIVN